MVTNNNVITAITLIERIRPLLHERDRAPIASRHLAQIQQRLVKSLELLSSNIKSPLVTIPLGEVVTLLETLTNDRGFVETSKEVKETICKGVFDALDELYVLAGPFYEEHEFDYSIGLEPILQNIVDANIKRGYYFGMEEQL